MISIKDIIKALTVNVRDTLGVKVNDRDITEGFNRPSFYIDVIGIDDDELTDEYTYDTYEFVIYYFAENRLTGFKELLATREKLRELLMGRIETEQGFGITFDHVHHEMNKADKTLQTTFTVVAVQKIVDTSDTPMIEQIEVQL